MYNPKQHHYQCERTLQEGGWGSSSPFLTYKHVTPSFQHLLDKGFFGIHLQVFLILHGTYVEDDFIDSMHPQITFKGIGLMGDEQKKQDINLVDIAEIGADFLVVGGVIRALRKKFKGKISSVISQSKKEIFGIDGKVIGSITNSLHTRGSSAKSLGLQGDIPYISSTSQVIKTNLNIMLTKKKLEDLLRNSRDMHDSDKQQYIEPRCVIRINYPEDDFDNTGTHPRGRFIIKNGKTQQGVKINTQRTSYQKLDS